MTIDTPTFSRRPAAAVLVGTIAVAACLAMFLLSFGPAATEFTMATVEADVSQRFVQVRQLPAVELAARMAAGKAPLLFDVRQDAEYSVSHLDSAVRIDPEISADDFAARYTSAAAGREVVFYCSVGMRSSSLAGETQEALIKAGARGVYNLKGGIFAWHNARRPLVDASGAVDMVHGYNPKWARLVERQDKVVVTPVQ